MKVVRILCLCFFAIFALAQNAANNDASIVSEQNLSTNSNENQAQNGVLNANENSQNLANKNQNSTQNKDTNKTQTPASPQKNELKPVKNKKFSAVDLANIQSIKIALASEFQATFPRIIISKIELQSSKLPKDFEHYEFLRLANGNFRRSNGYLRAEFKTTSGIKKSVFFRYFAKARIEVLRLNKDLERGSQLASHDFSVVYYDFDKVPLDYIELGADKNLVARSNIRKGEILRSNMFKNDSLVKKNDLLKGMLKDGDLSAAVELQALENGDLNETIRLKTKDGRVLQGVITGKKSAIIE